jgi:hypothetical protein
VTAERKATVVAVGGAAVAAGLTLTIIVAAGWSPDVGYVLVLAAVGAVVGLGLRRELLAVAPPTWSRPTAPEHPAGGVDPRIAPIELTLRRGVEDAGICRRRLQPLLFDLATHRLRQRHGVELIEDPERARELLGEQPFRFLTEVVTAPVPTAVLSRTVDAIEAL